ncbi:hypothetical protein [Gracilinema caldarium]|jgi:hypothetical protein|uniref:hypothetical protein n=1 Tax=Gracilinema caldarium TaxID=215591 RepID=UPI0016994755|nr:hypothetical protein [Gracilinema caldarium]NLJ10322.1 hypothetical protein [Treponema sp.]
MTGLRPIEFFYDLQLFKLKIVTGFIYVKFIVYREGKPIYRERVVLRTWRDYKLSHRLFINIDNKEYKIDIRYGKTEYQDLTYSLLVNGVLVAGEEPNKLQELTDKDLKTPQKNLNPFQRAITLMVPFYTLILTDLINQNIRDFYSYLDAAVQSIGGLLLIEILWNFADKGIAFLKKYIVTLSKNKE